MKREIRWWRPLRKYFEHTGCRRIVFLSRRDPLRFFQVTTNSICWLLSPGKLVDPRFLAVVVVPGKILAPRRDNRHPLATDASLRRPTRAGHPKPDPGELGALSMMTDAVLGTGAAAQISRYALNRKA